MKIKDDLVLRQIGDNWIVVPMGERLTEFNGIMKLNETGSFIWNLLESKASKESIIAAVIAEYDISEDNAAKEIDIFLKTLADADLLDK